MTAPHRLPSRQRRSGRSRHRCLLAAATAAEKRHQWEPLRDIANLAKKQYPKTVLGDYYLGRYFEETGQAKKAMRTFQGAFDKDEVGFITVDHLLDRADKIKSDNNF